MKSFLQRVIALAVAACGVSFNAQAQSNKEPSPADKARQWVPKQEQIQTDSQKLGAEFNAMIDEYERNGLLGDDTKNLQVLHTTLSRLDGKEMVKIIELLKQAAEPTDSKTALTNIAGAYSEQKSVIVQLKRILSSFAADQEALEYSNSVKQLAERQAANLQLGIETAQWALADLKPKDDALDASLQAQAAEQKAIVEEIKQIKDKLDVLAKKQNNPAVADRFKKGLDEIAKIPQALAAATDSLTEKKLFEAVENEKAGRDQLRQLAMTVAPPRAASEMLNEASDTLDKLIAQQKGILEETQKSQGKQIMTWLTDALKGDKKALLKALARDPKPAESLKTPPDKLAQREEVQKLYSDYLVFLRRGLVGVEDRQGDTENQTASLSQELDNAAQPAADALKSAIQPMRDSRTALTEKEPEKAGQAQTEALLAMEKARADLQQRLAAAKQSEATAGDKVANLREIQKQTQDLLAQQNALAKATAIPKTPAEAAAAAAQQNALQQKAAQLQQQAAADAPSAEKALSDAAKNMSQAADAMKGPAQNAQSQAQQQQASQNLAKADQQLNQQISKLAEAQKDAAEAQAELDGLAKIIQAQQKLQLDTAKVSGNEAKHAPVIRALAPRQQAVHADTIAYEKTLLLPEAKRSVASAGAHMDAAATSLKSADAKRADPEEQKALADLYSIKNALEAEAQAAQNQLGTPPPPAATAEAQTAAAALAAAAQAQLDRAMAEMNQSSDSKAAAAPLAQAAIKAAEAAANSKGLSKEANQAMQAASAALDKAVGQAAAGEKGDAQASGKKAGEALAQASAALAQAQAGIAGPNQPPSATPGTDPGPPSAQSPGGDKGSSKIGGDAQAGGQLSASKALFLGLPARDRATIQQAQAEKYPQRYAAKVEQYLQNLADESSPH